MTTSARAFRRETYGPIGWPDAGGVPATYRAGATGNSCRCRIRAGSAWASTRRSLIGCWASSKGASPRTSLYPAVDHRYALELTKHMRSHVKDMHRKLDVTKRAETVHQGDAADCSDRLPCCRDFTPCGVRAG